MKYIIILLFLIISTGVYCQDTTRTIKHSQKCVLALSGFVGTNLMVLPRINPTVQLSFGVTYSKIIIKLEPNMTLINPTLGLNLKVGFEIWSNKKK